MKKFYLYLVKLLKRAPALAVLLLLLCIIPARAAWTFTTPQIFWLTNSSPTLTNGPTGTTYSNQLTGFNLTLGAVTNLGGVPGGCIITNWSAPFPLVRDRGFMLHVGLWTTNAPGNTNALALTVLQFATPIKLVTNGVTYYVTNWGNTAGELLTNTWNATNTWSTAAPAEIYGAMLVPASSIQNDQMGRLALLINPGTNWLWWDPTNTFITITP